MNLVLALPLAIKPLRDLGAEFLPQLPTNGSAPSNFYVEALEIAFVAIGAILAIIVVLRDPIFPKAKNKKAQSRG